MSTVKDGLILVLPQCQALLSLRVVCSGGFVFVLLRQRLVSEEYLGAHHRDKEAEDLNPGQRGVEHNTCYTAIQIW